MLAWTGVGLASLAALLVLALLVFPWNVLRGPLSTVASASLGRAVTVDGDIEVKLAWHPWIDIRDVSIANVEGSPERVMAHADRIGLRIVPLSWFTRLSIPEVELDSPRLLLARDRAGRGNWEFQPDGTRQGAASTREAPLLGRVRVHDGEVRVTDVRERADVRVHVTTAPFDGREGLAFAGHGTFRGSTLRVAGLGQGLGELRKVGDPFHLAFHGRAGSKAAGTEVWFDGNVVPRAPDNLTGFIEVSGSDMSRLYPILPAPIPWTPPYTLRGRVTHQGERWQAEGLKGRVGQSDVAGSMTVIDGARRKLVADLVSTRLDYRDLGGFVGLPPGKATVARDTKQKAEARKLAGEERVLPDRAIDLSKLRDVDAEFRFRGKSVAVDRVPMQDVDMHIVLGDGVLRYDPVSIGIAGGRVTLVGRVEAQRATPRFDGRIEVRNVDLARLIPALKSPRGRTGRFAGYIELAADGHSVRELAATADGEGALLMSGGEASALALLLTNLDLANAIPLLLGGDKTAVLNCAVTTFGVDDGQVTPRIFTIDTSAVRIEGEGRIDLDDEHIDLTLVSHSKTPSLFALKGPIEVGGTLRRPTVAPSVAPIAARVGVAAGLAAIAPPLAIIPFLDPGGADDADCAALFASAGKPAAAAPTAPAANGASSAPVRRDLATTSP